MSLYRDRGVVLRTVKLGEADRIVTLFTQGNGRVRAVAKGVRRSGSRIGGRLEPTGHVAVQLYRGRELDVVTQVETVDAFRALREHYGALTHAVSMLEAVDSVSPERERNAPLYSMLLGALRTLSSRPSPLVAPAFFWKLLALEGVQPILTECVACGAGAPFGALDLGEGGVRCPSCASGGGLRSRPASLETIRRILGGELRRVLARPPEPEVTREVEHLGIAAIEHHLERRLRSAALL